MTDLAAVLLEKAKTWATAEQVCSRVATECRKTRHYDEGRVPVRNYINALDAKDAALEELLEAARQV